MENNDYSVCPYDHHAYSSSCSSTITGQPIHLQRCIKFREPNTLAPSRSPVSISTQAKRSSLVWLEVWIVLLSATATSRRASSNWACSWSQVCDSRHWRANSVHWGDSFAHDHWRVSRWWNHWADDRRNPSTRWLTYAMVTSSPIGGPYWSTKYCHDPAYCFITICIFPRSLLVMATDQTGIRWFCKKKLGGTFAKTNWAGVGNKLPGSFYRELSHRVGQGEVPPGASWPRL